MSCSKPIVRSCKLTEARTITNGASVVATKMFPTPILIGFWMGGRGGQREQQQHAQRARAKNSREVGRVEFC